MRLIRLLWRKLFISIYFRVHLTIFKQHTYTHTYINAFEHFVPQLRHFNLTLRVRTSFQALAAKCAGVAHCHTCRTHIFTLKNVKVNKGVGFNKQSASFCLCMYVYVYRFTYPADLLRRRIKDCKLLHVAAHTHTHSRHAALALVRVLTLFMKLNYVYHFVSLSRVLACLCWWQVTAACGTLASI